MRPCGFAFPVRLTMTYRNQAQCYPEPHSGGGSLADAHAHDHRHDRGKDRRDRRDDVDRSHRHEAVHDQHADQPRDTAGHAEAPLSGCWGSRRTPGSSTAISTARTG